MGLLAPVVLTVGCAADVEMEGASEDVDADEDGATLRRAAFGGGNDGDSGRPGGGGRASSSSSCCCGWCINGDVWRKQSVLIIIVVALQSEEGKQR